MKYLKLLYSPALMGFLFIAFALSMAVATFIENDFGSPVAYSMVYGTKWFELILLLLATNLIGQLIIYKLFRRAKLPTTLFHLSFLLLILGAAITRYFGWEGTMHIREGEEQTECYSTDKYITYAVKEADGTVSSIRSDKYSLTAVSADEYSKMIKVNGNDYNLKLAKIIPNAADALRLSPAGVPIISLIVTTGMMERETVILKKGDLKSAGGTSIGFESADSADVNIAFDGMAFYISSGLELGEMGMMSQVVTPSEKGKPLRLKEMQIISVNGLRIVPQQMLAAGVQDVLAVNPGEENTGQNAFIFHLSGSNESADLTLWNRESEQTGTVSSVIEGRTVEISYGSKITVLPFSIKLNDFILERYPGSNSPSGYKSDVVLVDKMANKEMPFMIFMNNILKYKGYRFYQSSFDRDEKGTILSVNHDMAGMFVTYTGYIMLIIFMVLSLINKNALFHNITAGFWNSTIRKSAALIVLILFFSGLTALNAQKLIPDRSASQEFGKVLVQDQKGRTKPLFTLSDDILRKVTRENDFEGLTSMQVFLGLYLDFGNWKDVPLIRISNQDIQQKLGIRGKYAAFSDIVNLEGDGAVQVV